jgi:mRNA-degrading endonuclease RelE of RelBE toxin-antitoxin system
MKFILSEITVSKKIKRLPPAARKQAQDFIDFLYQKYASEPRKKPSDKQRISDSPIFGMWKLKEEMEDSTEWVRNVRKSQWPGS